MKNTTWSIALKITANLSGWIAFPIIIGLIVGKWLDKKYGTEPWLFLATMGVSFLVSMYGLIVNAIKEFKKIEEASKNEAAPQDKAKDKQTNNLK